MAQGTGAHVRGKWSVLAHAGWVCWFGGLVVGDRALLALGDDKNFCILSSSFSRDILISSFYVHRLFGPTRAFKLITTNDPSKYAFFTILNVIIT